MAGTHRNAALGAESLRFVCAEAHIALQDEPLSCKIGLKSRGVEAQLHKQPKRLVAHAVSRLAGGVSIHSVVAPTKTRLLRDLCQRNCLLRWLDRQPKSPLLRTWIQENLILDEVQKMGSRRRRNINARQVRASFWGLGYARAKTHKEVVSCNEHKGRLMYAKVFAQMYDGTLCTRGPWEALVTFQQMLVLSDIDGTVDMTASAIARRTTIPLNIIEKGIVELLKPDPESRTPTEDGRRIVHLAEGRSWGWRVVNYKHYRQLKREEDRREYHREYWHKRKVKTQHTQHTQPNQPIAEAEAYTEKTIEAKASHTGKPVDRRFDAFWKAYPRKVGKDAARKAFEKRKPDDLLLCTMTSALFRQSKSEAWRKDGGQYIPNPATWLNQGRWQDEEVSFPSAAPSVEVWTPPPPLSEAEMAEADKARRLAMGAIKRVQA